VTKEGTSSGTVTSDPAGIDCGTTCQALFDEDTEVNMAATPRAGSVFAGWSGDPDCSDGQILMDADKACTATFNVLPPGPDLTGIWLSHSQICRIVRGIEKCTVKGKFREENIGELPAGKSKTRFFLSDDPVYNAGDQLLKTGAVPILQPGQTETISLSKALASGVNTAGKYLIACVDSGVVVAERDETNNCVASGSIP
jgi:hypothetical protein